MVRWGIFLAVFLGLMGSAWALLAPVSGVPTPGGGSRAVAGQPVAGYPRQQQAPGLAGEAAIPPEEVVYAYVEFDGRDRLGWPAVVIRPATGRAVRLSPATGFEATASDGRVYIAPAPVSIGAVDGRLAEYDPATGRPGRVLYRATGGWMELLDADPSGRWFVLEARTPAAPDGADDSRSSRRLLTVDLARGRVVTGPTLGFTDEGGNWWPDTVKALWCGERVGSPCAAGARADSPGVAVAVRYGREDPSPRSGSAKPRYGAEVRVIDVATGAAVLKAFFPTPEGWCLGSVLPFSYRGGRVWQHVPCRDARKFPRGEILRELDLARGAVVREVLLPVQEWWGLPLEHPDGNRLYWTRSEAGVTSVTAVDLERGRLLHRRLVSSSPRVSAWRGVGLWTRLLGGVARAKGYDDPRMFLSPDLSPDGRLLLVPATRLVRREAGVSEEGDGVWVLDPRTLRPLRHDLAGRDVWGDFHFSPDGRRVYALEREERKAKTLVVLDLATGRVLKEIPAPSLGRLVTLIAAGRSGPGARSAADPCAPERRLQPRNAGTDPSLDLLQSREALAVISCPGLDGGLSVHDWTAPGGEKVLFPPGSGVLAASWWPDGRRLIVQRFHSEFWLYDAAADDLRKVPAWPEGESSLGGVTVAGWSPRGDHVLLRGWMQSASLSADGLPLHVLSLADGRVHSLGTTLPKRGFAVWNPQGDRLAVAASGGRDVWWNKRLRVLNVQDGRVIDLSPDPGEADYYPVWSPDGRRIVYVSARGADLSEPVAYGPRERRIRLFDPDTGRRLRLTDDPAYADEYAAWTRSGRHIVFVRRPVETQKTVFEVWRMRPDGSGQEKLAEANPIRWFGLDYDEIDWQEDVINHVTDLDRDPPERKRRP